MSVMSGMSGDINSVASIEKPQLFETDDPDALSDSQSDAQNVPIPAVSFKYSILSLYNSHEENQIVDPQ